MKTRFQIFMDSISGNEFDSGESKWVPIVAFAVLIIILIGASII